MKILPRTDKSLLSRWWWSVDRLTLMALLILMAVGIVLVTAASPSVAERVGLNPFHFVYRQLIFLVPALGLMFGASMLSRKALWRAASVTLVVAALLMLMAILFGAEVKGATRWVSLLGFSLQPSEFIKPAFAITGAWLIARHQQEEKFPGHQITLALYLVLLGLLLLQPDLGMSFVLSCIWGVQVFLSGLPLLLIATLVILGAAGLFGA
jgi:cell division protein FtsW